MELFPRGFSDSLVGGPGVCISNKFPGDAAVAGLGAALRTADVEVAVGAQ